MSAPAVDPRHDLAHPPEPGRHRYRESYYFAFYDVRHGVGALSTIGYRPEKGHSGSLNIVYRLDGSTLAASEYDHYDTHDRTHPVAGLAYEPGDPLGPWRVRFDGRLNDGGADVSCALDAVTRVEASQRPAVDVSYDLLFTPDQPAYMYEQNPAWDGLFDGHVDEVGRVAGSLTIDGRSYEIDGRAAKDHSWGVRDWTRPLGWRWVDMLFEQGPELTLWRSTFDGERWLHDGAIYADGEADRVLRFEESVEFAPRPRAEYPASWEFAIGSAKHELRGRAEILRVVPLLFGMKDAQGVPRTAWIDKTIYRCELEDGRVGVGSAEFMFREEGERPRPLLG